MSRKYKASTYRPMPGVTLAEDRDGVTAGLKISHKDLSRIKLVSNHRYFEEPDPDAIYERIYDRVNVAAIRRKAEV